MENKTQSKLNVLLQFLYEKIADKADVCQAIILIGTYCDELIKQMKDKQYDE